MQAARDVDLVAGRSALDGSSHPGIHHFDHAAVAALRNRHRESVDDDPFKR